MRTAQTLFKCIGAGLLGVVLPFVILFGMVALLPFKALRRVVTQ